MTLTNPFPGPQPYRASDRARFHGRDAVARELTSMILAHRSVALFGPSGAGKSSVMQAAVLPTLADDHDFRLASVDGWPAGEAPVAWLLEALLRDLKLAPPTEPLGVFASVEWIVEQAFYRSDRPILIVLDQIEQLLFTQRDAAEVSHFLDWLDRFAGQPLRGLHLVLAMREDYLGRFRDRARGRHRLLEHGFRLGPMTLGEITGAVIAAAAGGAPPQTWSPDSTRSLMLQVRVPGQSERDDAEVQTAFAQIVCRALFAQRATAETHDDTDSRAEPILQNYLEGALAALGPLRGPAEQLLEDHIIAADGTRTLLTEEAARASGLATPTDLDTILTDLERAAILRAEQHRGTRYFEIGHDWLARKVYDRKQERLARAEAEARERAREAEQRAAAEALARARAETRRARRVVAVVTLFGLLTAALGVATWLQREAALAAEASVRAERDRANELLETAKNITRALLLEALPKYEDIPGTADVQREIHERLKTILTTLRNDAGDDPDVVHLEIQQKIKRGDLSMTHERLDQAREEYTEALALAERFAAEYPDDAQAHRDLSASLLMLSDVEVRAGDLTLARALLARSLREVEDLVKAEPHSTQAQRDLTVSLIKLGDIEVKGGNLLLARELFARTIPITEDLAKAEPHSAQAQRDLSVALNKLGDVELQAGNLALARDLFGRDRAIAEDLAKAEPHSAKAQRDLAVSLNKLGEVEVQDGSLAIAHDLFARSLFLRKDLAKSDPHSALAKRDLSVSLKNLGEVEVQAGNLDSARDLFAHSLKVAEGLAQGDPDSPLAQRDLSVSLERLGHVEVQAGNFAAARSHLERALTILEPLAKATRDDSRTTFYLVEVHLVHLDLARKEKRPESRREHLEAAKALLDAMSARGQITGIKDHEAAKMRVDKELAALKP
ncbi:MAG: tetratricopeptide repeat protein [Nannocystis sp.]|nr:tetratricopeptide repeat protein [Nannocystis sp.]